jgi:hypothetical protein
MDRNRDGGEGWMVRGWHALTFVVECEVLALTLNPRTPMANLIRSLRGAGASACRAAPEPDEGSLAMGSSSDGATSVRRGAIPTAKRRRLSGSRSRATCNYSAGLWKRFPVRSGFSFHSAIPEYLRICASGRYITLPGPLCMARTYRSHLHSLVRTDFRLTASTRYYWPPRVVW